MKRLCSSYKLCTSTLPIKRYAIIYICCILFCFSSCKMDLNHAVRNLYGRKISLTEDMKQVLSDTVIGYVDIDIPIKIIINADPRLCNSCFANYYDMIVQYMKYLDSDSVKCVCIMEDIHKDVVQETMKTVQSESVLVLLDSNKTYLRTNSLEEYNNMLTCFLLDKNNRVVLVGDPLRSSSVRDLYEKNIKIMLENDGFVPKKNILKMK